MNQQNNQQQNQQNNAQQINFNQINEQCCPNPFPQINSGANIETCLACGIKTKLVVEFECPYCHHLSDGLTELDLEDSEGNTDWCECDGCEYNFRKHELIIRSKKVKIN